MSGLSRRRFLGLAGGAAGATAVGLATWQGLLEDHLQDRRRPDAARPGRLLVVLELGGGNDGLNTVVPGAGAYRDARPTLAVAEPEVVALRGEPAVGLHPALAPLTTAWDEGRLALVQGVGFEAQTRSHFAATDTWRAGTQAPFVTSWLGRWLDATGGAEASPLRAVALGTTTRILDAAESPATVVIEPRSFQLMAPTAAGADPAAVTAAFAATARPVSDEPTLAAAQLAVPATLEAVDVLTRTAAGPAARSTPDPYRRMTELLATAARIVALDVGTEIVVIGVDGYDTHARQDEVHPRLLTDLAEGVTSFLAELERQGRADDVLVVTTSEFGRRVAENGSAGTDHGNAGTQLLLGDAVNGGLVGELGLDRLVEGDLPITVDARSLYAVALDWLGGPTDEVLDGRYDRLGLLAPR